MDILLVDEAHLLLTKQDVWKNFKDDNHLEELLKLAKTVIIIFDKNQILKIKSFWDKKAITRIKKLAPSDVMEWVNELKEKNVKNFPKQSDEYEFKVFETIKEMHEVVKERNEEYGLSRVVSTFDYLHMKDGETYYVKESIGNTSYLGIQRALNILGQKSQRQLMK
ncbi:DNA/RNA helicase domain-containing protein [Lysinibacillus fusiformis]|uniref:DNA/RNA helicase domain-containing protein n=1 Tax=Lysinibacillus fusiformis TaxID=28031 RepID=UPI0022B7B810|nr:DNA/RNA helicase domain-containing protein [Lysinibacillus fusiformis]